MKYFNDFQKKIDAINYDINSINERKNDSKIIELVKKLSEKKDRFPPPPEPLTPRPPSPDRIKLALQEFVDNGFRDLSHARLLCSGCIQALGASNYRLIEDPKRFQELLNFISSYAKETRPFRKCYQRLLNIYFLYDAENSVVKNEINKYGLDNKEKLRQFLNNFKSDIKTADYNPQWIMVLHEHSNILSDNPCANYGHAALHGNRDSFNEMCKGLQISNTSWLIGHLVLSACDYAVNQPDDTFKQYIMPLIGLFKEHPLYVNRGLVKLLNRYVKCEDKSMHIGLREYSVQCWGNPWLNKTKDGWQHCSIEARNMVTNWLKRHLLREFFSILSHDGAANTRRLDFWELYCEAPQNMYFALGSAAYDNINDRFKSFRKDAEGLCKRLDGGTKDLHAFIMQYDGLDVIEFSLAKNSTYFYKTQFGDRPYNLDSDRVDIGSPNKGGIGLKAGGDNPPFSIRRSHSDTGMGLSDKWEQKYAAVMGSTTSAIQEFCRKYKCDYVAASSSGSYDWIMLPQTIKMEQFKAYHNVYVVAVLLGWGFSPSNQKNGWYREGR